MKSFVALLAVVAVVAADVSHLQTLHNADVDATIVEQSADVHPEGFDYSYQTSNGISGKASGNLQGNADGVAVAVQGSSSYTAPDGQVIQIDYTADEYGYHPQGAHLPTPPPPQAIPEAILRSLEYIRTHPQPEQSKKY